MIFQLFVWRNNQFEDMGEELGIPEVAKTVGWAGDSLCVGFKKDYYLIKVSIFYNPSLESEIQCWELNQLVSYFTRKYKSWTH